ncbi:MAG: hypothetical protein U0892_19560 [Pirellulales bacterium]
MTALNPVGDQFQMTLEIKTSYAQITDTQPSVTLTKDHSQFGLVARDQH